MNVTHYIIKCQSCAGSSEAEIDNHDRVFWTKVGKVISARKRLDGQWGFQCVCGNNDLMTIQEKKTIANWQNPQPTELQTIMKNLKFDKPKFNMESL